MQNFNVQISFIVVVSEREIPPFRQFHFPFVCLLLSPLQMQKWVVICWAALAVVGADVCPDGGLCKEGETCCNSPANGYGCCRYENVRPGVIIPSCNLSVHDNVIIFIVLVLIGFLFAVRVGGTPTDIHLGSCSASNSFKPSFDV